jgi:hypothetical protein
MKRTRVQPLSFRTFQVAMKSQTFKHHVPAAESQRDVLEANIRNPSVNPQNKLKSVTSGKEVSCQKHH